MHLHDTSPTDSRGNLVTSSAPAMQRAITMAHGVARAPTTVLLTGESGTGKEVVARLIHDSSPRAAGPFVAVNCAAIPGALMESELFGHEKGAFTGASDLKRGTFEMANGGTLVLDEVSELPMELQAKLLRVIQERRLTRLGGHRAVELDVRIIATSNRDLSSMVRDGRFRQDLYYRLNVFPITLPPLRERQADLRPLASVIVNRLTVRMGRPGLRLGEDALAALRRHDFPGNVRELQNLLERAVILTAGPVIEAGALLFDGLAEPPCGSDDSAHDYAGRTLAEVERDVILGTLRRLRGNRTRTSEVLGISIRTLRNRLRDYRGAGYEVAPSASDELMAGACAV